MRLRSRKVRYLLILGALLTGGGGACSSVHSIDGHDADVARDADGHDSGDADADQEQDAELDADDRTDADVEPPICPEPWQIPETWVVQSPPEGIEPTGDALCAASGDPAETGQAGRVTLSLYSASYDRAVGQISIPSELQPLVVEGPRVEVVEALPPAVGTIELSDITPSTEGFSFNAIWTEPYEGRLDWQYPSLTLRVEFDIRCDESGTVRKTVSAVTHLNLCDDDEHRMWVSSGDECRVCLEVCEMAPSPVIPKPRSDGTALPRAIELDIVPVAEIEGCLHVIAEHRGTNGPVAYSWTASSGEISGRELGGASWRLPIGRGNHVIQVAVSDSDSAAVASLVWNPSAR